jgi:phage terminase large subunit-like protein
MMAVDPTIKGFSSSTDAPGAEDLRRLYKAGYKSGRPLTSELQLELREVCVLGGVVPISPCGKYWYDAAAGERVIEFFRKYLVHIKGELGGKPIELMQWEQDQVIRPLFGWKRWDGLRRYRELWLEVPRKNDKTTLAAGLALYLTLADGEPGAEVYSAAADRDQAGICFGIAKSMVESSSELASRTEIYTKSIVVPATFSSYKVLSADAFTKHGLNAHAIVVDEVHAQKTRELIDTLHTSTGSRRQPLEIYITTAGHDRHSICYEKHEHALRVLTDPTVDEQLLVVIYAADPIDDWKSEATWHKANPGLGLSKKLDYMRAECNRAVQIPGYENTFKRLDLNIWTEQASRWLPMAKWDQCVGLGAIADPLALRVALRGRKAFGGLDLANTIDINAYVLAFLDGMTISLLPFFWIPAERLESRKADGKVPWAQWVKAGLVKVTDGATSDYDVIRSDIEALAKIYPTEEVGFDRWNALQIATQLDNGPAAKASRARDRNRTNFVIGFGQGYASMTMPCKALEAAVVGLRLRHAGHPVLRWMAANVAAQRDAADNIKPDKEASSEKIDGIVAGLMAIGRALVHQPKGSIDGWLNNPVTAVAA